MVYIPENENIPLQELDKTGFVIENIRILTCCNGEVRAREAVPGLQRMGYISAAGLGGISGCRRKAGIVLGALTARRRCR